MRARNFIPLAAYLLFLAPLGLLFIFVWEDHGVVLLGAQLIHAALLVAVFRAGVQSARKNWPGAAQLGGIVFLPLKIHLFFYLAVGLPLVWLWRAHWTTLMVMHGIGTLGFSTAYLSTMAYFRRSSPD